jgi:sialate O-acetylesterase
MKLFKLVIAVILLVFTAESLAKFELPSIIDHYMVLQQNTEVNLWGWIDSGEHIEVSPDWLKQRFTAKANNDGKWELKIPTINAGGPYTITFKTSQEIRIIHEVMLGEVWICSGQSNMDMPLEKSWAEGVLNYQYEIANSNKPLIRLFTVDRWYGSKPKEKCGGRWRPCLPETSAEYSAVAYFFAKEITEKLGIPVGLIHTSWGGTPAEAWTSEKVLRTLGDFDKQLDLVKTNLSDEVMHEYYRKAGEWGKILNTAYEENLGFARGYSEPDYNDNDWKTMVLPTYWEDFSPELKDLNGVMWFRKKVIIPSDWASKDLILSFASIADCDVTYWNGVEVGRTGYETTSYYAAPRNYRIRGEYVKPGPVVISVRDYDDRGNGGIYGDADKLKITLKDTPEKSISLKGDWKYFVEVKLPPEPAPPATQNDPSVLYNTMVAPLLSYNIKGAIWYQGESNVGRADQYKKLFPAMIKCWRDDWGLGDFPFYFVQLAPYEYGGSSKDCLAYLREAQFETMKSVANTGMAVTTDAGDLKDIHPRNKQAVGKRLALWALAKTYGVKDIVYSGPLYKNYKIEGDKIRVFFDHADTGLVCKGDKLVGFSIADKDRNFISAEARIEDSTVVVYANGTKNPVAVRFGWSNVSQPNLFNKENLPASPFRTDTWR